MNAIDSLLAIEIAVFAAVAALGWWIWHRLGHASQRYGERFNESVEVQLERAYLFIDPRRLLTLNALVVIAASGLAFAMSGNILIAVVAALISGSAPRLALAWMKRTRRERFRLQLPDLMLLTAGGLRAGGSLWQALAQTSAEMATPARQEVEMMLREQRLGVAMEHALAGLERRMNVEEMRLFGAAIRIAHETGGNLAETLEGLADSTRRKQALEGKVRALTSQGRLQGWVMGTLPMALGLILFQIEPRAMGALFTTWYGGCVCVAIVVLQLLGFHFVRRIVTVDV